MQRPQRLNADVCSGAVLAALGAYIVQQALQWQYIDAEGPGPGFFPLWYGVAMIVLALWLIGTNVLRAGKAEQRQPVRWTQIVRALISWAAFTLSIALLKVLGFVVSFALLTFFVVAVMYRQRLHLALTVGVLSAAGFYLVFPLALGVGLPTGMLGF